MNISSSVSDSTSQSLNSTRSFGCSISDQYIYSKTLD
jgi:hypothetical protein